MSPVNGDIAPDHLGADRRRAVTWLEGAYITLRPSFGDNDAIYAYRTEIVWDSSPPHRWCSVKAKEPRRELHPVR